MARPIPPFTANTNDWPTFVSDDELYATPDPEQRRLPALATREVLLALIAHLVQRDIIDPGDLNGIIDRVRGSASYDGPDARRRTVCERLDEELCWFHRRLPGSASTG